jgi:hypothetical protein
VSDLGLHAGEVDRSTYGEHRVVCIRSSLSDIAKG